MVLDLQHGAFDFCHQMQCPMLVKPDDCRPHECVALDTERKRLGSIYLIRPDGTDADFVTMLPGIKRGA